MKKTIYTSIALMGLPLISNLNAQENQRPNILIIIADDCTYSELPLYGGKNVKTPEIDKFASEGLTFNKAYVSMSMSTPCRTELYTGYQPVKNGVCWNHSQARKGTKSIVQYLGEYGYRTGIAGKVDVRPREVFPFEMVEGLERKCTSKTAKYDETDMKEFMSRNSKQPFCLVVGLITPHVPWTVGDPSHFDPKTLKLPPYLADTKVTRESYTKYLAEIEVLDQQVGKTLRALNETGNENNTIVIFTSEQGAQLPFCKWTNFDNGVHTALIARWKGVTKAGVRTNALIQYCDVLPTLLDAVGDKANRNFDGSSFLPVIKGEKESHRKYAYFMHNNIPEGPSYPIRSITDGQYHYIRNLDNSKIFIQKFIMGADDSNDYWKSWMFNSTNDRTNNLINSYMIRPAEQLYDLANDKYEQNNLAGKEQFASKQLELSNELDKQMKKSGDPGKQLDTNQEFNAQKKGEHFVIKK